jgi:hypothetical protein
MVDTAGVEPATSVLSGQRSNQLSYASMAPGVGFEPTTYWLTANRSTNRAAQEERRVGDLNPRQPD